MLPQVGSGGLMPIPRKDSDASSRSTFPTPSAAETMIGAAAFGRTWRKITRPLPAPSARAATTKSRCRSESTSARTSRLVPNHDVSPMAMTSAVNGRPSHRATAISRMKMRGRARPTSTPRISTASIQRW
ncbi:MAG: hypothetical protein DMD59_09660 [Gemmatimonadetes bacterium]|nr:MAG: hypothetical protein DMD59_09660 [Gemmatimonadota bacterium]